MKKSVIIGLVASGMFIAGCGEKAVQPQAKPISGVPNVAGASNVVVVAIGDAKLMSADLEADVARFIEANKARIPAEQLDGAKQYLTQQLKQQFITKTLLTKEAAKKGISVTDEEVKARADELIKSAKGRPGAPNSFDELLAMHPLGAERAREEFKTEAYPAPIDWFEQIMNQTKGGNYLDEQMRATLGEYYEPFRYIKHINKQSAIQARLPYFLHIN